MAFHAVRFPAGISLGASGGPERRTEIVVLGSGAEERNSRWADSKRSYNAGYGIKSVDDLHAAIAFFEERRGGCTAFAGRTGPTTNPARRARRRRRWTRRSGWATAWRAAFQLTKTYGSAFAPWSRVITQPVTGTVLVAVDGVVQDPERFAVNATTGMVTFLAEHIPAEGAAVSTGFEFDVPVRFDTDQLEINLAQFEAGSIPHIPIVEIRLP